MWLGINKQLMETPTLRRLDDAFPETEGFEPAQPLTARLRGVMVAEDRDGILRGNNDLTIASSSSFESEPPVERLHYMGREDELGWRGDFFDDVVLSIRDLRDRKLVLHIQVYDIDGIDTELIEGVQSVASEAAVLFPQLGPFSGLAVPWIGALLDLIDNIDDHDKILDGQVKLEMSERGMGHKLLQPGYYVCFDRDVHPESGLALDRDLQVVHDDGTPYEAGSYAVVEVSREFVDIPAQELDYKVAKLVAELQGKGQSKKVALDFLRDTLGMYTAHKKIRRVQELQSQSELSPDEERLLNELLEDEDVSSVLGSSH